MLFSKTLTHDWQNAKYFQTPKYVFIGEELLYDVCISKDLTNK